MSSVLLFILIIIIILVVVWQKISTVTAASITKFNTATGQRLKYSETVQQRATVNTHINLCRKRCKQQLQLQHRTCYSKTSTVLCLACNFDNLSAGI